MNGDFTGQLLDGKYLISKKLGEGGMGSVYMGEHVAVGRRVAIKLLHSFLVTNEEVVKRFFREARAAAAIAHRNIIDVLDMGVTAGGEPYLVMEFLEGRGLDAILAQEQRLDLPAACAILEPALAAIGAAHRKGVIHRDLKPDNIFVTRPTDGEPDVKLIDFGISKFQDSTVTRLTVEGTTMGTPAYMSPEQARGAKDLNHTTDIYAVGIILYEMLTGTTPFAGDTYNELFANILTSDPRHPQEVFPDFPMAAWPVIEKAIAKDPRERFLSAEEMTGALRALCPAEERLEALRKLGERMSTSSAAAGDLGAPVEEPRGPSADRILEELVKQRTSQLEAATMMAGGTTGPENDHTILAVPTGAGGGNMALAGPASTFRRWMQKARFALMDSPRKNHYRAGAALIISAALLIGLCSSRGSSVEIHITGLPKKAVVFYDGSIVTQNPFRVKQGDTLVPLRVEVRGKERMNISITPSVDLRIAYTAAERAPVVKKVASDSETRNAQPQPAASSGSEDAQETPVTNRTRRTAAQKKEAPPPEDDPASGESGTRRNPFKKLGSRIRNALDK